MKKDEWLDILEEKAKNLSKAMELRFNNRLSTTVNKVLDKDLSEDQVVVRTGAVLNAFFDTLVGTTVGLIAKHANPSEEMEQRVLVNVSRWFAAIRAMEEKNGNH